MAGDFSIRMRELEERVGWGTITAIVEYNQVYAHRQHEDLAFKHPRGGPKFLERALFEDQAEYMEIIARSVLTDLPGGMTAVAEHLASKSNDRAPRRANMLTGSVHPSVQDNEAVVYDRPPRVHRLSEEEIEELNKALQDPHHYYGVWPPVGGPKLSRAEQLRKQGKLTGPSEKVMKKLRVRRNEGRA